MDTVSFFNFLRKNTLVNPFSRDLSHLLQKWLHGRLRRGGKRNLLLLMELPIFSPFAGAAEDRLFLHSTLVFFAKSWSNL